MAGGGNRKDDSVVLNSTNVFAALGTLRKKKKSDKEQGSSKTGKSSSKKKQDKSEPEPQVFWAPAPLTTKSWADVDDEDDDDYYATTAPPQSIWAGGDQTENVKESLTPVEESESEEEEIDEVDDDNEEEHDHEVEVPAKKEPIVEKPVEAPKDTDRQLSKKELKKKELAELDAVLAELGFPTSEASGQEDPRGVAQEKKVENPNADAEKQENNAPGESKSGKKKKKKDKASKESKEQHDQICDMVTVARMLNLTLVVPELDKISFWTDPSDFEDIFYVRHFIDSLKDEIKIIKRLPKKFTIKYGYQPLEMPPVSWSSEKYFLEQGMLLYGPSGTGKTLLARAFAHHT